MAASPNRRYIRCEPLAGHWAELYNLPGGYPPGIEPVALLYRDSYHIPDGLLVLTAAGYMHWHGGAVRGIDQRKVRAALDSMAWRQRQAELGETVETPAQEGDRLMQEDGDDEN